MLPTATTAPLSATDRFATTLATWFGSGYAPVASGTVGTFFTLPLVVALWPASLEVRIAAAVLATALAIWAADRHSKRTGGKDPKEVVIDEVAGTLVTAITAPPTWLGLVVVFFLFRLLDIWKPFPARQAERGLPGGWGIVLDDVLAGAWGAFLLQGAQRAGWL